MEAKIFLSYMLMNYELRLKAIAAPKFTVGLMYEFDNNKLVDFIKIKKWFYQQINLMFFILIIIFTDVIY